MGHWVFYVVFCNMSLAVVFLGNMCLSECSVVVFG